MFVFWFFFTNLRDSFIIEERIYTFVVRVHYGLRNICHIIFLCQDCPSGTRIMQFKDMCSQAHISVLEFH